MPTLFDLELAQSGFLLRSKAQHKKYIFIQRRKNQPSCNRLFDASRLFANGLHLFVDFLPNSRHTEKGGRPDFTQCFSQSSLFFFSNPKITIILMTRNQRNAKPTDERFDSYLQNIRLGKVDRSAYR
jgi:hypothetical protein